MSAVLAVTLPHGTFADGKHHRDVELRALRGADEAFLLDTAGAATNAERVTGLLARCLRRIGREREPGAAAARALTVGDREALLLRLRASCFGARLPCLLDCRSCGERMDVDLDVDALLVAPYAEPRERYEHTIRAADGAWTVRFRLPTGADQEAAAAADDLETGVRTLLDRCVERVSREGRPVRALPAGLGDELSRTMAELDPQAEILLRLDCPHCAEPLTARVDAASALFSELAGSEPQLLGEVHALAATYHWSEADILRLDVGRRRRYLDLVSAAAAGATAS